MATFRLQLKDPDRIGDFIREVAEQRKEGAKAHVTPKQFEQLVDDEVQVVGELLGKWIWYGEYIAIEFDLETMAAKVLEEKR